MDFVERYAVLRPEVLRGSDRAIGVCPDGSILRRRRGLDGNCVAEPVNLGHHSLLGRGRRIHDKCRSTGQNDPCDGHGSLPTFDLRECEWATAAGWVPDWAAPASTLNSKP